MSIEADEITEATRLREDLDMDSQEIAQLVGTVEKERGKPVADRAAFLRRVATIGDVAGLLPARAQEAAR
uniref:Acyl carrier protein n=1 Tax=Streptomyces sp. NBC_00003 TaxID=2903608 RepID=A0AAU2VD50_9ACTN